MQKILSLFTFLAVSLLFINDAQAQCSLTGSTSIPQGQTRTYTATALGGASYFWSTTGGLSIVGSNTGRTVTVRGNSNGTVCYTRYRAGVRPCCQCKNVTVNNPSCPTSVAITSFVECIGRFAIIDLSARLTPVNPGSPVTYSWTKISGSGTFIGGTTSAFATMRAGGNSTTTVRVTATCQGSSVTNTRTIRVGRCNSDFPIPEISPNPVDNSLKLNLKNDAGNGKATVEIINKRGEVVITKSIDGNGQIDMSKLQKGLYFVRTKQGNKVKTELV